MELDNLQKIKIDAKEFIKGTNVEPITIDVIVKETNEKVGMLEYYCAEFVNKKITLIYVKFKDEKNYPAPYPLWSKFER